MSDHMASNNNARKHNAVIFDLGGVLIDWNPRYLYRKLIDDEPEMEAFLTVVCTPEWNEQQDAGRTVADAVAEATARHPDRAELIAAYYERFDEMMSGAIEGTVQVLAELRRNGTPCFALSNWAAETFSHAERRFAFLDWFDDIVVSGRERLKKPDPAIFSLALRRFGVEAGEAAYIDDAPPNVTAAARIGLHAIQFVGADALRRELTDIRLLG